MRARRDGSTAEVHDHPIAVVAAALDLEPVGSHAVVSCGDRALESTSTEATGLLGSMGTSSTHANADRAVVERAWRRTVTPSRALALVTCA